MPEFLEKIQNIDNGARFYKVDLHFHTPASHDYKVRNIPYDSLVHKALENDLDMIAVTDHNIGTGYEEMRKAATGRRLVVLPGVEIIVEGVHLLAILPEKDTAADIVYLLHNLRIKDENMGKKDTISDISLSIPAVLDMISGAGGIAIAAHTDSSRGLTHDISGTWRTALVQNPALKVVEITHDRTKKYFDGQDPIYRRRLSCIKGSDAHHPDEIGQRATWIKMGECSFRGLSQIIHEPGLRISLREPSFEPYPRIIGMYVTGGLYEDEVFSFNRNLNCLIGGRGAGKSAIIDLIRFVLGYFPRSEAYLQEFNERIVKLLGVGNHARLYVENEEGRFIIDRALTQFIPERVSGKEEKVKEISSEARVYQIINDQAIESSKKVREVFEIEVFGQSEVFELTRRADDQLKLIDEYVAAEKLFKQEKEYAEELKQNASEIIGLQEEIAKMEDEMKSLKLIKGEIEKIDKQLKGDVFRTHGLWQAERSYLKVMGKAFTLEREKIETRLKETACPELPMLDKDSPNFDKMKRAEDLFKKFFSNLEVSRKKELSMAEELQKELSGIYQEWKKGFEAEEREFTEKLKTLGVSTQKALSERLSQLKEEEFRLENKIKPEFDRKTARLKEQSKRREELLKSLQGIENTIYEKRKEIIEKMSKELEKGDVKISINRGADKAKIFNLLDRIYTGSDIYNRKEQIQKICEAMSYDSVSPLDLVNLICQNNIEEIKERFDITHETARKIIKSITYKDIFQIQVCPLEDELVVYLKKAGEEEFSPLKDLSYGEKCTAVFSIALLGKKKPLLVDQPEDELDHAFIIKNIVEHIRNVKEKRQLLISTHNANIPVLGDAELIFKVTKVPGVAKCKVEERGAFEKESIIDRLQELEGGREAFKRRREKYGIIE